MKLMAGFVFVLLWLPLTAQGPKPELPCSYKGDLLRDKKRELIRFNSTEMKKRAVQKKDVNGFTKQADIKGTVIADVLVGPDGNVQCIKMYPAHPLLVHSVGEALRDWRFSPEKRNGTFVAYLGRLEFHLCNTNCGKNEFQMSIVKQ
jgi:hypothetical protein